MTRSLARDIPTTCVMGISADDYDGNWLKMTAPAAPNLNDKQTAFAGSSYSIAAVCGWSLLFVKLLERGIDADIAVYKVLPVSLLSQALDTKVPFSEIEINQLSQRKYQRESSVS